MTNTLSSMKYWVRNECLKRKEYLVSAPCICLPMTRMFLYKKQIIYLQIRKCSSGKKFASSFLYKYFAETYVKYSFLSRKICQLISSSFDPDYDSLSALSIVTIRTFENASNFLLQLNEDRSVNLTSGFWSEVLTRSES